MQDIEYVVESFQHLFKSGHSQHILVLEQGDCLGVRRHVEAQLIKIFYLGDDFSQCRVKPNLVPIKRR